LVSTRAAFLIELAFPLVYAKLGESFPWVLAEDAPPLSGLFRPDPPTTWEGQGLIRRMFFFVKESISCALLFLNCRGVHFSWGVKYFLSGSLRIDWDSLLPGSSVLVCGTSLADLAM